MIAIHARYRGRSTRRAELVRRSARALDTMDGVLGFEGAGIEDIRTLVASPRAAADLVMALLADGEWALGVGAARDPELTLEIAGLCLPATARRGVTWAAVEPDPTGTAAHDIAAAFRLLAHVLAKRSPEGRAATALVRRGWSQNEAARQLGISKQAMSQRLQAAGWQAELAGWQLAVNLLRAADPAPGSAAVPGTGEAG